MRRGATTTALAATFFALHCGGDGGARYAPEGDDRFVASLVGAYEAPAGGAPVTLLVCEDEAPSSVCVAPADSATEGCARQCHVLRGGGRAESETLAVRDGAGCGCTTASAELAVRVELVLADGSPLAMRGSVTVVPEEGEPYGAPVALRASAAGERPAPALSGEVRAGGLSLRLASASRAPGAWPVDAQTSVAFRRTAGPEACALRAASP